MPDIYLYSWNGINTIQNSGLAGVKSERAFVCWKIFTSLDKVVNEESWRVAVRRSKEFAVGCGVGEGNLLFGQVTAENKRAPENPKTDKMDEWMELRISDASKEASCDQMTVVCWNINEREATWRCPACGWRCSSAWPGWTPRSGWSHRELARGQWSSTRPCVSPWSRPSSYLSVGLVAPGLCKPEETTNISIHQVTILKMDNSKTITQCFFFSFLTWRMCSATRQPTTMRSVFTNRNVLACVDLLSATCWKPSSLSATRRTSSACSGERRQCAWISGYFCEMFKGPTTKCCCCPINLT